MANIELNDSLNSVSGRIGKWVYRRKATGGVTVARRGTRTAPPSTAQTGVRNRFREAAAFARDVLSDGITEPRYRAVARITKKPVFAVAITDFFTPPVVHVVIVDGYHGAIGDKIKVLASDDVDVVSVDVAIKGAGNAVLEHGAAVRINQAWIYTATTARPAGQPVTIEATAKDRPGNTGTLAKTLA